MKLQRHLFADELIHDTPLPAPLVGMAEELLDVPLTPGHVTDPYWVGYDSAYPLESEPPLHPFAYQRAARILATHMNDHFHHQDPTATAHLFGVALRSAAHMIDPEEGRLHLRRQALGGSLPDMAALPGSTPIDLVHLYVVGQPPVHAYRAVGERVATIAALAPETTAHGYARTITDAMYATGSRNPADDPDD